MATKSPVSDLETRQRLLDAAARLFADRGFQHVTVRDICGEAEANVAAVNYYFRDKWGLYLEVIQRIVAGMKRMSEKAHDAGPEKTPEERLRHYVRTTLEHFLSDGHECLHGRLMSREMADPTAAFDLIVDQAIRPNSARVGALISELMGKPTSDPRVGICVGSIQTQLAGMANPVAARMIPGGKFTPELIEYIAQHIANFSLGGIRAVADEKPDMTAWNKLEGTSRENER
jgi:AcrR family transcriptional regulator